MLSIKQNFLETINGGNPDRFVNQYEFMDIVFAHPLATHFPGAQPGGEPVTNQWGVTTSWPEGMPGGMPIHDSEHTALKDITQWKQVIKEPNLDFPDEEWQEYIDAMNAIDRDEKYATLMVAPGLFENVHHLMGIDKALIAFYTHPEEMKELINFFADFEIKYSKLKIEKAQPEALFHHDDWGTQRSSFMSPEMFEEFFFAPYKRIYNFYKESGIEIIVHHSDCYAANLVPYMIKMGIDVWQGAISQNNVPDLVKKYGKDLTIMGDLNNGVLDRKDWTPELVRKEVKRACTESGKHYFIPCLTQGLGYSHYEGVYDETSKAIAEISKEMF